MEFFLEEQAKRERNSLNNDWGQKEKRRRKSETNVALGSVTEQWGGDGVMGDDGWRRLCGLGRVQNKMKRWMPHSLFP